MRWSSRPAPASASIPACRTFAATPVSGKPTLPSLAPAWSSRALPRRRRFTPRQRWRGGGYGRRLDLYRATVPHAGFSLLKHWGERMAHGYGIFTSNVDGQLQKAGVDPPRIDDAMAPSIICNARAVRRGYLAGRRLRAGCRCGRMPAAQCGADRMWRGARCRLGDGGGGGVAGDRGDVAGGPGVWRRRSKTKCLMPLP
ncbi:hypothetical protein ACFDR9_003644 [Janthinobacterium sp. CG_23.3]